MKIYFTGSIAGGREFSHFHFIIIEHLQKHGTVLTEHFKDKNFVPGEGKSPEEIFQRDINWVKESDVIIAEVTTPSLGVGYEISKAEEWKKNVLCLFKNNEGKKLSPMICGNCNILIKEYSEIQEALRFIDEFFEKIKKEN